MRSIPVSESIHWVGAIDWNLRDFHGYETPRGTTYNAYLVRGKDKTALIDTVKEPFVDELLSRVRDLVDPAEVDLIVVNHVEPDHNGGLPKVMAAMPNARVVASRSGVAGVAEYHNGLRGGGGRRGGRHRSRRPDASLPPDADGALARLDVHLLRRRKGAHAQRRVRAAYGVIGAIRRRGGSRSCGRGAHSLLGKHPHAARQAGRQGRREGRCDRVGDRDHRPEPRRDLARRHARHALRHLRAPGAGETREKIVVAFSTMWGSTDILARAVVDGIAAEDVEVDLFDLAVSPIAHVTRHLLDSRALLLGSPTLHHGMLYRVAGYLQYLSGLKPQGKLGGAFGSYGWSSGACKQISGQLEAMGFDLPFEPYTQKYRPTDDEIAAAREWGAQFARAIKEME
jgi:anaerobic nitric oxide reductase flavorubredoxin